MNVSKEIKLPHLASIFILSATIWFFLPMPEGLTIQAWHMLIIFVASMVGIMLEVLPLCGALFISLLIASLTETINLKTSGLSGFSNIVPWLLFSILALSKAITKSSIGLRIAYFFIQIFGRNLLGLAYSLSFTELTLSTILPSNTARAASVGFPIVSSLSKYISSSLKGVTEKAVGGFLTLVYTSSNAVCSAMFITAMISNAIIVDIAEKGGLSLSWIAWASHTFFPGLTILLVLPLVLFALFKNKQVELQEIRKDASIKAKQLGPLSEKEKIVLGVFLGMLIMWVLADFTGISIITTTLLGIVIFLLLGIFSVKDILSDHGALSSVLMLSILISYVNCMTEHGTIDWFNSKVSGIISIVPSWARFYALSIIYFLTHYFFSGEGARVIALYGSFTSTGLALGIDKVPLFTTLAAFSVFSDMLAHYTAPASILMFSNGYISAKRWMSIGIIISAVSIALWFLINSFFW